MNLVMITGRMVRDPVMRQSKKSGRAFCSMRFAIEGDYRGAALGRTTSFVNMIAWGDRGRGMFQQLRKGQRMLVRGSIEVYDSYDAYGQKRESVQIFVKEYEMIDSRMLKAPVDGLADGDGNRLIPAEVTDSLIRQIDTRDEDVPEEFADIAERRPDDLF